jgi:transposase-like protein
VVDDTVTESTRKSAPSTTRRSVVEVVTRGEPRRRWSDEDRARILAEAMAPGGIASHVARSFGVSTGQFYTWRKAMLLRSAACGGQQALAKADFAEVQLSAPRHGWPGGAGAAGVWSGSVLWCGLSVSRQAWSADQMRLA